MILLFASDLNAISFAAILFTAGVLIWVFSPMRVFVGEEKTRAAYLRERKDAVYENLRDLNFEYKAGKLSDADYESLRNSLESEAASLLAEIERLEGARA